MIAQEKIVTIDDSGEEAEFIMAPNVLRDKVTVRTEKAIDFGAVNNTIAELAIEFSARLPNDLSAIREEYDAVCAIPDDQNARDRLFRRVHDLKGQAGTFDYKLITVIGNDLCRFLEQPVEMNERRRKVVGFHIDAMERVSRQKMIGTGGDRGMTMINTLKGLTHKVLNE